MKVESKEPLIRIIYLSPLPKENSSFKKFVKIIRPIPLKNISIEKTEGEKFAWDFLCSRNLQIFEIIN